jgi:hypothetical protein
MVKPGNHSWITKIHASSWRTLQKKKMSHHPEGDSEFFDSTMQPIPYASFFAPYCHF